MAQELEILKIFADLSIFLASITIPTYAIAISFLGPEYNKMVDKVTKAKECLEKELREKAGTDSFKLEDLEQKIKDFHDREAKLRSRFNPLSLYPTIIFPNIFFIAALSCVLIGIYLNADFIYWIVSVIILISTGVLILEHSLSMIQKASKESRS
jgi:ABC-type multidrug transport system fused ATPase/permease subunit